MVWPAVISAIGALAGGALSAKGQRDANEANLLASNEGRKWMEAMSDSAYQRAVKDMQKAGLSPMLAYSQGGAHVPSQSAPISQNVLGAGVSSAAQGASAVSAIQGVLQSQAQTDNILAQTDKVRSETMEHKVNTAYRAAEVARLEAEAKEKGVGAHVAFRTQHAEETRRVSEAVIKKVLADVSTDTFSADVARRKAESEIARFGVAEARAGSKFYEEVEDMPKYLRMIVDLLRGGSSARSLFGGSVRSKAPSGRDKSGKEWWERDEQWVYDIINRPGYRGPR